jgi:hypothetical protein
MSEGGREGVRADDEVVLNPPPISRAQGFSSLPLRLLGRDVSLGPCPSCSRLSRLGYPFLC